MKKFVKIFLFVLFLLGIAALVVCYIVIPEQTKNAVDIVVDYVNRPLPIAGVSILTIGGVAYTIFSKTSFGKKQLNAIRKEFTELNGSFIEYKNGAEEYYNLALKTKEEVKAILSAYTSEIDNLTEKLVKVCETSPNKRINAIAKEITDKTNEIKTTLNTELEKIDSNITEYVEEKVDVKELQAQILALQEMLKGLGVQNGEREETTNN